MDLDASNCPEDSFCYATALLASSEGFPEVDFSDNESCIIKEGDIQECFHERDYNSDSSIDKEADGFPERDDSDDDSSPEKDGGKKEVKNRKERERVEKMNAAFVELQGLLQLSSKTTKHDTLVAAVSEIQHLEYEIVKFAGRCSVPKPLGRKRTRTTSKKRPPNKFLQFSKAFRGTFLRLLQDYRNVDRIDNREVTKFLSIVWRHLDDEERVIDWTTAALPDRKRCSSLAMSMLTRGQYQQITDS